MPQGPLMYYDRQMNPEPINIRLTEAAELLSLLGKPVSVVLEPGDGTRYELCIVPAIKWARLQNWAVQDFVILVVRSIGGEPVEADAYRFSTFDIYDMRNIGQHNEWTRAFIAWWLKTFRDVCDEVKKLPSASANSALPITSSDIRDREQFERET